MTDLEYRRYLNKYAKEYKIRKDDDQVMIIIGKYGQIEPYGVGKLQCWIRDPHEGIPPLHLKRLNKLEKALTPLVLSYLAGDGEATATFLEERIADIAPFLGIKKRRQLSETEKAERVARLHGKKNV